jgi:hypothetical protein
VKAKASELTPAACFAALYFVLAGYFAFVRRKALRERR